jgi:4-hydroxybenzoyl-CoA reductase subunit beta
MGTIGGNILLDTRCVFYNQTRFWRESISGCLKCDGSVCHVVQNKQDCFAAHSADTVPVLMVMGAKVVIAGPHGERTVAIESLYGADGRDSGRLETGELLVRVIIPKSQGSFGFRKLRMRGAIDYPLVVTAVQVTPGGGRVVVSGVGPTPIEIEGVSEAIASRDFAEAGQISRSQVKPLGTHNVSPNWRRHMVEVEVRRCLEGVASD